MEFGPQPSLVLPSQPSCIPDAARRRLADLTSWCRRVRTFWGTGPGHTTGPRPARGIAWPECSITTSMSILRPLLRTRTTVRPLPELTPANEWFWSSGADGVLRIQGCEECGQLVHTPVL